jgi:hypothetical protein
MLVKSLTMGLKRAQYILSDLRILDTYRFPHRAHSLVPLHSLSTSLQLKRLKPLLVYNGELRCLWRNL